MGTNCQEASFPNQLINFILGFSHQEHGPIVGTMVDVSTKTMLPLRWSWTGRSVEEWIPGTLQMTPWPGLAPTRGAWVKLDRQHCFLVENTVISPHPDRELDHQDKICPRWAHVSSWDWSCLQMQEDQVLTLVAECWEAVRKTSIYQRRSDDEGTWGCRPDI